ncbi:restriction endonuclease subunit S [Haemophilus parainfluenzae]|uniref:restriction endonuclease subunit S n=1 Tax=Haemophilus parainfluenzae TaxID=729 RepID=UPI00195819A7|nr:restriction endonuclease subunit S [Haemophilus parainfluenzae]VTX60155.1 Type-1 restriction enzyme EcoKI specificity protein [Haemophilus parainfluenzae]
MKNNRTFLEKLLDGAEVEWKPLKDVAEYIRGVTYNKANESTNNIGYKVLRANNITLSGNTLNFDDIKVIKFDTKVKSSQMLYKNDILISAASGSREHVGKVAFIYQDIDYYFGGFMGVIRCNNNVNSRYLFHIFTSSIFQDYLNEVLNSSTINNLNSKVMDSFRLPIPPLSVQTEIVKILDALTALTSELTSELTLRRKQYEYYRKKLLSFDSLEQLNMGGAKKKLIDVAYFQNGKGHEKNIDENGSFIVINSKFISTNGAVKKYCNDQLVPLFKEDILIVMSDLPNGKALAKTFFVTEDNKYTLNQRIGRITVKEGGELLPSFVNHFLNRNKQLTKYDNGTDQTNLRKDQILDVVIPIPSLEQQQRIVSILDKFETLTNSITEGLPLAIEQSQKRYEYYRELLLNFPGRE